MDMEQHIFLGAVAHFFSSEIHSALLDVMMWNTDNKNHNTMTLGEPRTGHGTLDVASLGQSSGVG